VLQLEDSQTQDVAIDGSHPGHAPATRVAREHLIDRRAVSGHTQYELFGNGTCGFRQLEMFGCAFEHFLGSADQVNLVAVCDVDGVQDLQRRFARAVT
jgi:hypothetical protein